jgi:hypothetical protein
MIGTKNRKRDRILGLIEIIKGWYEEMVEAMFIPICSRGGGVATSSSESAC